MMNVLGSLKWEKIMGEIADMMLEGILCEMCGVYLGRGDGFPKLCRDCVEELKKKRGKEDD